MSRTKSKDVYKISGYVMKQDQGGRSRVENLVLTALSDRPPLCYCLPSSPKHEALLLVSIIERMCKVIECLNKHSDSLPSKNND